MPQGSARSAPQGSAEPAPTVAPAAQEQRSGGKRAASRGLVLQLAPKKALRVLSASAERIAAPSAASGGVPGEVAGPTVEVAPVTATGGVVTPLGVGESADPAPPSASSADPAVQSVVRRGPQVGEVIDLDADEAEGAETTETVGGMP
nr:testis-specific gene A8 protein-like [Setaria viridis]